MIIKRFTLLFRLQKKLNYVKGPMPIYIRITIDPARTELSTNREWEPDRWNRKTGRATGSKEDAKLLNVYLQTLEMEVSNVHRDLLSRREM